MKERLARPSFGDTDDTSVPERKAVCLTDCRKAEIRRESRGESRLGPGGQKVLRENRLFFLPFLSLSNQNFWISLWAKQLTLPGGICIQLSDRRKS